MFSVFSNSVPIAALREGVLLFYFAIVATEAFRIKVTFRLEVKLRMEGL